MCDDQIILKTKRLTLRSLTLQDAPALYHLNNDFDVVKMTATWPWPIDLAYVEGRLRKAMAHDPSRNTGLGIFLEETLIGNMGGHVEAHGETGEEAIWVGYMVGRDWWGKGLMTEALAALCPYLWSRLGKRDIYAEHFYDNPASGRVMRKVGFEHLGPAPEVWSEARQAKLPGEQYRLKVESENR